LEGLITYPSDADFNPRMTAILAFSEDTPLGTTFGDALAWPNFAPAYRIGHLPVGRYTLRVLSHGFVDQTYESVLVSSGATTVQDINLEVGAILDGLITDAITGLPLEGARVEITDNGKTDVSDASGAYAVSGLATGSYNLHVSKPGYADFNAVVSVNPPTTSYSISLDSQAGSIRGRVVDGNAAPVNGAQVVAYNPLLNSHETGITVAGDFAIADLPAGDYVLGIHATGFTTVQYPPSGVLTLSPNQGLILADLILLTLSFSGPSGVNFGDQLDLLGLGSVRLVDDSDAGIINLYEVSLDQADDLNQFQLPSFTLATLTFNPLIDGMSTIDAIVNTLGDANGDPLEAEVNGAQLRTTSTHSIPEPMTLLLFVTGLAGFRWQKSARLRENQPTSH
jgi:hypothetical protein